MQEPAFDTARAMRADQLDRMRDGKPQPSDLSAFRRMLQLSAADLAAALGVDEATLLAWESGASSPDRTQRSLLSVIARHPRIVLRHELPIAG